MILKRYIILLISIICSSHMARAAYDTQVKDANFLKFLQARYPDVLQPYTDVILAEKAAVVNGCFDASSQGISDITGIQCFTAVEQINLQNNNLSVLPSLQENTVLKSLNVSLNQLQTLPSLHTHTQLIELIAYGNKLKTLPELSYNTALRQIIVNSNQLVQLPTLSSLRALENLILDNNLLTSLPNLNSTRKLLKLSCSSNQLLQCPVLDSLTALRLLDFSHNKLNSFPGLTYNQSLELLYLNDNNISYIYNIPLLPHLESARLQNNLLTFSSLTKVLIYPNHKTIFLLSPQRRSQDTQILDASRTDTLAIQTHIDSYINHVYYLWYKNNAYYKTCTYDKLTLSHLSFADSGTYHCEIKHDSFPDIAFRSDKYELKVNECINTNQLALHITPMDCEHRGVVSVSHTNNQKLKYILVPKSQYAGDTSVNGSFNNLVEGSYSLQIVTDKGCLVSYPKDINIAKENCTYPLITPNGDGDHDEYYFEQLGEVSIYDKKGNLIKTMSIPGPWDASSPTGKVRTGLYVADVNHGEKIIKISVVY